MRMFCFVFGLLIPVFASAQQPKVNALPDFVLIPAAADRYEWKRVLTARDRTIFYNDVAVSDSMVWSFGGFDTKRVLRSLLRIEGRKLITDSLRYPGAGFMNNVFFFRDSTLYAGGGLDSSASRYSFTDFWRYDLRKRSWLQLKDLPFYNLRPLRVFTEGSRVLVLVLQLYGPELTQSVPVCYEYFPERDEWRVISQPMPLTEIIRESDAVPNTGSNSGIAAAAFRIDNELFVLFQPWVTAVNTFFRLNLENGSWTKLEPFPAGNRSFNSSFAFSDGTYGYVGGGRARNRVDNSREVFRYDAVAGKWERIADLPSGLRYGQAWKQGGRNYLGFGINDRDETVTIWELRRKQ